MFSVQNKLAAKMFCALNTFDYICILIMGATRFRGLSVSSTASNR